MYIRRAIKRGALIVGIVWLALSVEILFLNVVFPSKTDNDAIPMVMSYLGIFAALYLTGMLAARDGTSRAGQILAGLTAGVMIGALLVATFAIVDNVWLDVVSQQQTNIDGFAHSDAVSMRDYINHNLIGPAVFFTIVFGAVGAMLGGLGGLAGHKAAAPPPIGRKRPT